MNLKHVKVAVLSDFTITGLSECLRDKSHSPGIEIETYEGKYGQWRQEIMGDSLVKFKPDIVFLILDLFGYANEDFFDPNVSDEKLIKSKVKDYLNDISSHVDLLKNKTNAKIVISNNPIQWNKTLGIIDGKLYGYGELIKTANQSLENNFRDDTRVLIFDFDGWLSDIGKKDNWYGTYYFIGELNLNPQYSSVLAEELISYLIPLSSLTKKCLVLDLDNVLWGGIVGEDGFDGISLSPTGAGSSYYFLQKWILGWQKRGIILAISSRNNEKDALHVIKDHPYMVLREDDFGAQRINWDDKAKQISELAEELNIGIDSMVFADDDPVNCALVKERFPSCGIIELSKDGVSNFEKIKNYRGFSTFQFTEEDKKKSKLYSDEKKRKEYQAKTPDLKSFLKSLNLEITIRPVDDFSISRAAQLTQKTNQFNLTTQRYQVEDIKKIIKSGAMVWTLSVKDKFGDYGITGLAIVKEIKKGETEIDSFLLSCRILGKKLEEQFLGEILNGLVKAKVNKVKAKFIATEKNMQTEKFYDSMGFRKIDKENYELDLAGYRFRNLDFIKVSK